MVLLNDCRDHDNFGAQALVDGLISILSTRAPTATLLPVPSHWMYDKATDLRCMVDGGEGLRYRRATFPTVADQFETISDEWLKGRGGPDADTFLRRFDGADIVVLNGEGSIYRTNHTAVRELFLAWLAKERLGIPTVYVNGGLHLTGVMPILPAMVRKTFRCLDAVAVREAWSLRNLEEYVPEVHGHLFPDSAFVLTTDDARESEVVARIREQVGGSPYFCFDPGPMPMDGRGGERSALYQMITALRGVVPRAVFVRSARADQYIEEMAQDTGSCYVDTKDYREFMALVSGAEFVVSGRYHNVILAGIMGCPSIAFGSSSHKVHGACEMLDNIVGSPYDGTDLRTELDAIADHAAGYVENRDALGKRLRAICLRRRVEAFELGNLVLNVSVPT
jgi:polysaccharide pyruvyl transferase WcaK-like protein